MQLTSTQIWGILSLHFQQKKTNQETVPVLLLQLEQKLLAHGGIRMVYRHEPDIQLLLARGKFLEEHADIVAGERGQCHCNVAHLWSEQREALAIVTRYALSADGLWRQHSWLLRQKPGQDESRLIETTVSRGKYFGAILTEAEAERFFQDNG